MDTRRFGWYIVLDLYERYLWKGHSRGRWKNAACHNVQTTSLGQCYEPNATSLRSQSRLEEVCGVEQGRTALRSEYIRTAIGWQITSTWTHSMRVFNPSLIIYGTEAKPDQGQPGNKFSQQSPEITIEKWCVMHLPKLLSMMEEYNFRPSLKYCNRSWLVRLFCFDSRNYLIVSIP